LTSIRPISAWDRPGSIHRPNQVSVLDPTEILETRIDGVPSTTIGEFWSWAFSDLKENTTRGVLAEFLVAKALDLPMESKAAWEPYDLDSVNGSRIEVKASGYLQAWATRKLSNINFSGLKAKSYDPKTGKYSSNKSYHADIYLFCKQSARGHDSYNILDLDQWEFYVTPREYLEQRNTNSISEGRLKKDGFSSVSIGELNDEFRGVEESQNLNSNSVMPKDHNRWANVSSEWNKESINEWLANQAITREIDIFKRLLDYATKNADVIIPGSGEYPGFACAYDVGEELCAAWSIRSGEYFRLQIPFGAIKLHLPGHPEVIDYYLETLHKLDGDLSSIEVKGGWPTVLVKNLTDREVDALKRLAEMLSAVARSKRYSS